ncbi:hypothetical protein F528_1981, partial [Neisseria meningitidis 992008]
MPSESGGFLGSDGFWLIIPRKQKSKNPVIPAKAGI